jgi:hypothetical protein
MTQPPQTPSVAGSRVVPLPRRAGAASPIVCLSHLRWDFVFQRPQHLMTRFAADRAVFYVEEPLPGAPGAPPSMEVRLCAQSGVTIVTPRTPEGLAGEPLGVALAFANAVLFALYIVLADRVAKRDGLSGIDGLADLFLHSLNSIADSIADSIGGRVDGSFARLLDCVGRGAGVLRGCRLGLRERRTERFGRACLELDCVAAQPGEQRQRRWRRWRRR